MWPRMPSRMLAASWSVLVAGGAALVQPPGRDALVVAADVELVDRRARRRGRAARRGARRTPRAAPRGAGRRSRSRRRSVPACVDQRALLDARAVLRPSGRSRSPRSRPRAAPRRARRRRRRSRARARADAGSAPRAKASTPGSTIAGTVPCALHGTADRAAARDQPRLAQPRLDAGPARGARRGGLRGRRDARAERQHRPDLVEEAEDARARDLEARARRVRRRGRDRRAHPRRARGRDRAQPDPRRAVDPEALPGHVLPGRARRRRGREARSSRTSATSGSR